MNEARRNMMGDDLWKEIRYFKKEEFTCKCGCGETWMDRDFVFRLDSLRERLGSSVVINSGYRCLEHNKAIGGSPRSQHLKGRAADVAVDNSLMRYRVVNLATIMLFSGIGVAKNFVHIDNRSDVAAMWTY